MLGRLGMTVDQCLEEYENLADRVFKHARVFQVRRLPPLFFPRSKYNKQHLEDIIKEVATKYDTSRSEEVMFPQSNGYTCRT